MLKPTIKTPRDFINPLLSKRSVEQAKIELFKKELDELLKLNQSESEEHQKNDISTFLHNAFDYKLNTKDRIDLCIYREHKPVVILEAKKLDNKLEMISTNELNRKAFHEALLYFCRERDDKNDNLKHIIILNALEWFVFDAKDFDKLFWQDKNFKKIYDDWKNPSILGDKTADFYKRAKGYLEELKSDLINDQTIECAHFNLKDQNALAEKNILAIYKLLSPDTLLKEFNPNDANSLNRAFYTELLYILGLEETKDGSKKLIGRAKNPQSGTLYENIANKLSHYGKPNEFETVIKLIIIWINRILFLKLLESQIYRWSDNDKKYKFLNTLKIKDYDDLETLFFDVLAKRPSDRTHKEFAHIPYLNSSLFEMHELEDRLLKVSNLEDGLEITYHPQTSIKDENSKRKNGKVATLEYLFEFLDAYDFSSEGSEEVVSSAKTLINASVLGLIFEKINGYKDGSFYTPSFITMYMAREAITKAVLQKFNESKKWNCQNLTDLYNEIKDAKEANEILDSITICDPAVGSGHFLVSALNEILRIKSELGILCDESGKKLKDYTITIENDELIVIDENREIFEYKKSSSERARVQKTLFKEKQKIIENSLFGVDINPNSVNICRLRLWIELLKNAYYKEAGGLGEPPALHPMAALPPEETAHGTLETLPNIDINIKCGNSLISRFGLKDEIKIKNIKAEIKNYKQRVYEYKENLGTKKDVLQSIENLKEKFKLTLKAEGKLQQRQKETLQKYAKEFGHHGLNDNLTLIAIKNKYLKHATLFEEKTDNKKRLNLLDELQKLEAQIEEIEKGKIYENAFEWRFEFPEALDENGDFVGFDMVIGNPPYIPLSKLKEVDYGKFGYEVFDKTGDILALFFEKATQISKASVSFITSNSFLKTKYGEPLKRLFVQSGDTQIINFEDSQIFDEATVESCITTIDKLAPKELKQINIKNLDPKTATPQTLKETIGGGCVDDEDAMLMRRIEARGKSLKEWDVSIYRGITTGYNEAFIVDALKKDELVLKDPKSAEILKPVLRGRDVQKYSVNWAALYVVGTFPALNLNIDGYPAIKEYLLSFGKRLDQSGEAGSRKKTGNDWFETQDQIAYWQDFEKPKIVWGEISDEPKFAYDDSGLFGNDKIFIMTGESLKYLLAFLNSKLSEWYFSKISVTTGQGTVLWKKYKLELLPIPNIDTTAQEPFIALVDKIMGLKKIDPKADTAELEAQIDAMVYALYGLSDEEIKTIEGEK